MIKVDGYQLVHEYVAKFLPEFVKACKSDIDVIVMHQDAFAADYQIDEFLLLGCAVKYAGIHDKEVRIIPRGKK